MDSSPVVSPAASEPAQPALAPGAVQLADAGPAARAMQDVLLPRGAMRIVVPVQAGQTIELPSSAGALYARIGAEGNLAIVLDGRTIILGGYVAANEEAPVHIVGADGREIDIVEVLAATDPSLDIVTAAGPAAGPQGEGGSGIYTPFAAGAGIGGLDAIGILDPTALRYRLIDDERRIYPRGAEEGEEEAANGFPSGGETAATVDDEGLPAGIPGGTGDVPGEDKTVSGTLPGGFGPDGPGGFSFAALDGTQTALGTETIDLSWDEATHTLIGAGPRGDLFSIAVDPATGAYTFTLLDNVLHAPGADENDALLSLAYTVTDGNGDAAPGTITITIDDDSPRAAAELTDQAVVHDETKGVQHDADDVAARPTAFAAFDALHHLHAMGWAVSDGAVVSAAGSAAGADSEGATIAFSLKIPFGVVNSGVDTTEGDSIWLFQEGNLIVGRVGSGADGMFPDSDGEVAFAVSIDPASGVLGVAQYLSLEHPVGGASHDESIALANGAIQAVVTVTDGDGDVATAGVDIGNSVGFQDDGPCAAICLTGVDVAHDESAGRQGDADDVSVRPAAFAGFEALHHLVALGWAVSPGAVVTASGATGADNEGATAAFSLSIASAGIDSGIDTTDGRAIFLFQEGGLIVGRVGGGVGGSQPDSSGAIAFAVSIDAATGKVSVGQYLSLAHPNTANHDESIALANGAIQAVVTVTDGDGDVATASANIGGKIAFQDDGPCPFDPEDSSLANAAGSGATGDLDIAGHTGVDGFGAIAFANITDGQVALGSVDGVTRTLKCGGETIYLFTSADDTMLTGTTDPAGKDAGDTVFTLTLNGAGDSYSFNLVQPIDNGAGLVFSYFGNAGAGNNEWIGIFTDSNAPAGGDANEEDLLLTPINAKYVNTSATDIGVDNQHINAGEGVRIDFVLDVNGDQKSETGFTIDGHFLVTDSSFKVAQIQGSDTDAVVRIRAYDADDDQTMTGDKGDIAVPLSLAGLVVRDASGTIVPVGTGGIRAYLDSGAIVVDGLKEGYTVEVKSATPYDRLEITNADGFDPDGKGGVCELDGKGFEISTISVIQTAEGSDIALHYDTVLRDGDGDQATSPDGIDLALLASAMPLPAAHSEQDLVAGQGGEDDTAFAYRQSADPDGDAAPMFSAARFADADQDNDCAASHADSDARDLWVSAALDDGPADARGDGAHAISVGEVLDRGDAGGAADTDADSGALPLDQADGPAPAADAIAPDAGEAPADAAGDAAVAESLADTALGDLLPYFIVPNLVDQIANEDIPAAL